MRKFHIVFTLVLFCFAGKAAKAQAYEVSTGEASYQPLATYVRLNESPWPQWHSYPDIPIGFAFQFFDRKFESLQLEVSSRLVFDKDHFYFYDPLAMVHVQDAGTGNTQAQSLIGYHTTGAIGEQVFTIEYRDVRLARDTSLFVNFQVKLYEKDHSLELHMGPSSEIKPGSDLQLGPYSGVYQLNSISPIDFKDALNLMGDPQSPKHRYFSGQDVPYLNYTLKKLPSEGQVIKYVPTKANSIELKTKTHMLQWNAMTSTVHNKSIQAREIKVYNLLGQSCLESTLAPQSSLSLGILPKGSYLMISEHQSFKILL